MSIKSTLMAAKRKLLTGYLFLKILNLFNMKKVIAPMAVSLTIGTLIFAVALIVFVDKGVMKSPILIVYYLLNIESTYKLSAPIYGAFVLFGFVQIAFKHLNDGNEYGDARFATEKDMYEMEKQNTFQGGVFKDDGIILGKYKGKYVRVNDSLSTLIVAPQGTGKTAAMIIPTLLSFTGSAIINDVKGELWNTTSKQRSLYGRVGLFSPSKKFNHSLQWNPFHEKVIPKDFADQIDFVDRMATLLYPVNEKDGEGKHFQLEARSIFTYWAMLLIGENGGTSLPEIYEVSMESGDMQTAIAIELEENEEKWHSIMISLANSILQKGGNEWNSCLSTFKQAIEPFSRPNVARNLRECDFTPLDFKADEPFSLYLFIPANDLKRMAPIVRMLMEYLCSEFLSIESEVIKKKQLVLFAVDEFPRMGYMEALMEGPALQRSYRIATIFVAQNKEQFEKTYGQGSFDHFLTVTDFKQIFRQNEDTTAARFSSLVGKVTRKKKSISSRDAELLGTTSTSSEGVPLLLPQDFMNQDKNKVTILISDYYNRPIVADAAWWFKDRILKKLAGAYQDLYIGENEEDETLSNYEKFKACLITFTSWLCNKKVNKSKDSNDLCDIDNTLVHNSMSDEKCASQKNDSDHTVEVTESKKETDQFNKDLQEASCEEVADLQPSNKDSESNSDVLDF